MNLPFVKGHATCNDFVILADEHNERPLSPEEVATLCHRRAGIGADGILRAVRARHIPEWDGDGDLWFMDYRNADGSIAEMCGNGLRLFVRHLHDEGLVGDGEVPIATRAGLRSGTVGEEGVVSVGMGPARVREEPTEVVVDGILHIALAVNVGNPHAVVFLQDPRQLEALDLSVAPSFDAEVFPEGTNIEFVVINRAGDISMRVYERGVGETMSCGTGVVASAAAYAYNSGYRKPIDVHVPGGSLRVDLAEQAILTGPTAVVARGETQLLA